MGKKTSRRRSARAAEPKVPAMFEATPGEDGLYQVPRSAFRIDLGAGSMTFDPAAAGSFAADDDEADSSSDQSETSEASGGGGSKRFTGVANSGRVILNHPWWGNFALNMDGASIPTQRQPVLRDHDTSRILGHTSSVEVDEDRQLVASGELFDVTQDGREVLALAEKGFPFQMSVWAPPSAVLQVMEGEEVEVNGHTLKGPGHVFEKFEIREVTVTPLGADANTSVDLLSRGSPNKDGDMVSLSVSQLSTPTDDEMSKNEQPADDGRITRAEAERLAAEQVQEAVAAERTRLSAIDEHADGTGVPSELVAKLKADGVSADAAAVEILSAVKKHKSALLTRLEQTAPETNNNPEGSEVTVESATEQPSKLSAKSIASMPETVGRMEEPNVDKFKAEWEANVGDVQDEFDDEPTYLAYRRNTLHQEI